MSAPQVDIESNECLAKDLDEETQAMSYSSFRHTMLNTSLRRLGDTYASRRCREQESHSEGLDTIPSSNASHFGEPTYPSYESKTSERHLPLKAMSRARKIT